MNSGFQSLSDDQWSLILSLMNLHLSVEQGIPRSDVSKVWSFLLFVLIRGCRWVDFPKDFDVSVPRSTALGWLKTWRVKEISDKVMSGLLQIALQKGKRDLSQLASDGSFPLTERDAKKSATDTKGIPKSLEEPEIWQGAAMNLSQAKPTPKQLNLNKLSNAGGSQIHWQATLAKTDSSSDFGIIQK